MAAKAAFCTRQGIWNSKKVIQRVFGDDPREQRRATIEGARVPCGLRNLGATCYLNSMLQCLFVSQPFRSAVYEWEPKALNVNEQQELQMRALQKLFAQMQLGNRSQYDPTEFASTLALNNVVQQDAQVCVLYLSMVHCVGLARLTKCAQHKRSSTSYCSPICGPSFLSLASASTGILSTEFFRAI